MPLDALAPGPEHPRHAAHPDPARRRRAGRTRSTSAPSAAARTCPSRPSPSPTPRGACASGRSWSSSGSRAAHRGSRRYAICALVCRRRGRATRCAGARAAGGARRLAARAGRGRRDRRARRRRDHGRARRAFARAQGRRLGGRRARDPRRRSRPATSSSPRPPGPIPSCACTSGDLVPLPVAARFDDARFGRVWEIGQRGAHAPEAARGTVALERRFGALTLRRVDRAPAVIVYDFLDALDRGARLAPLAGAPGRRVPAGAAITSSAPTSRFNFVRLQTVEVDTTVHRGLLAQPVANATVVIDYPAVPLGRELVDRDGPARRLDAQGRARASSTCASSSPGRRRRRIEATNDSGWQLTHIDTSAHAGRVVDVRFEITSPAPSQRHFVLAGRGATMTDGAGRDGQPTRLSTRARDRLVMAVLALATVTLAARRRGPPGLRARRGPVLPRGRALLGLVRGARRSTCAPATRAARSRDAEHRSLLERQRARSPRRRQGPLRPLVARLSPLHLHGPGARPASHPRARPPHHAAAVRARVDGLPLPGDPLRGAAGGARVPLLPALRRLARRGRGRRADARAAALLLPRADRLLRRAHHDDGLRASATPTGSRCAARAGACSRASSSGVALGTKHNAWLMPIFLAGHYLWMRRGDLLGRASASGAGACRACRWRSCRWPCSGRSSSSCTGRGCGGRRSSARARTSTATSSTSTTTSSTSAGTGTRPSPTRA